MEWYSLGFLNKPLISEPNRRPRAWQGILPAWLTVSCCINVAARPSSMRAWLREYMLRRTAMYCCRTDEPSNDRAHSMVSKISRKTAAAVSWTASCVLKTNSGKICPIGTCLSSLRCPQAQQAGQRYADCGVAY